MNPFLRMPGRRVLTGISATAIVAIVVPLTVTATTASWPDREWVHAEGIGTSSLVCGTDTGFTSTASGDFLSGALLGTNLDEVAALSPQQLAVSGNGTVAVSPSGSIPRGSTPPTYTYTNPLNLSVLGGLAGLNLTGLGVGLPVGSAGAVNQFARVSGDGTAAGASGLVTDTGGALVSDSTPDDQLPEPATVSLASLLPVVTGVAADPSVEVGAVAATSQLDACAALRSAVWGGPAVAPSVTREYGIAGLDLSLRSALLGALVTDVNTAVAGINTAIGGLLGPDGAIAAEISLGLKDAGLNILPLTGTVTLSGLDLQGAITRLSEPLADDVVSIDLGEGTVGIDLAALLSTGPDGLNNLEPNTELLLNATVVNNIVDRVGGLIDVRLDEVISLIETAIANATLRVALNAGLVLDLGPLLGGRLEVANIAIGLNAPLGSLTNAATALSLGVSVLPSVLPALRPVVNGLLAPVAVLLSSLTTDLVGPIADVVDTTVIALVEGLGATLADVVTDVVDALAVVLAPLPNVLSVTVNLQPDQPDAPPGSTFIRATNESTAQYKVTALRLGVGDGLGGFAFAELGTASAGPVTAP